MTELVLNSRRLDLILESTEATLARIDSMPPADRAQVSPDWLAQLKSAPPGPWTHGFNLIERETGKPVGSCGFKGPPDEGIVEIAYGIDPNQQGRGFAKEAAAALVEYAFRAGVRVVRAHTLPERNASTTVLEWCGFRHLGEVIDPEDGLVWRWEREQ